MGGNGQKATEWARYVIPVIALILFAVEMTRAPSVHQDFVPLYSAASMAVEGRLDEAYDTDPVKLKRAGPALTATAHRAGYPVRHVSRYLHAPAVAMLFVPFTVFDFPLAAYLFRTLSLLAMAAAAFFLGRMASRDRSAAVVVFLGLVAFDPARMTLDLGQTNLFVLALVTYALLTPGFVRSGVALGIAALLKTFVLAVPLVWLVAGVRGFGRRAGGVAVLVVALLHVSAYIAFPDGTFAWVDSMRELSGFQFLWPEQQSMASQVVRAMSGFSSDDVVSWTHTVVPLGPAGFFPAAWALAVGFFTVGLAILRKPDCVTMGVLALCGGLLASPVLHSHYGLMLAVAGAWVVRRGVVDLPAVICLAGIALQALPLHSDEGAFWVPLTKGMGSHWVVCSYRLVGVMAAFAGVALAVFRGIASAPARAKARVEK